MTLTPLPSSVKDNQTDNRKSSSDRRVKQADPKSLTVSTLALALHIRPHLGKLSVKWWKYIFHCTELAGRPEWDASWKLLYFCGLGTFFFFFHIWFNGGRVTLSSLCFSVSPELYKVKLMLFLGTDISFIWSDISEKYVWQTDSYQTDKSQEANTDADFRSHRGVIWRSKLTFKLEESFFLVTLKDNIKYRTLMDRRY